MGIKKDIHLTGDDYQWLSSMFYFGQSNISSSLDRDCRRSLDWQQDTSHGNTPPIGCCRDSHWPSTLPSVLSCGVSYSVAWLRQRIIRAPLLFASSLESSRPPLPPALLFSHHRYVCPCLVVQFLTDRPLVVYEERAGYKSWHLVQLQWMGADLRWPRCLWNRQGCSSARLEYRAMENRLLGDRPAYCCCWHAVLRFHA